MVRWVARVRWVLTVAAAATRARRTLVNWAPLWLFLACVIAHGGCTCITYSPPLARNEPIACVPQHVTRLTLPAGPSGVETVPAGALSGSFSLSSRGEALFVLPLATPPGRAGVEPKIALSYSSSGGDGVLGASIGVPAMVVSTTLVVGGAANVLAGFRGLTQSMSSGSGSGGSTPPTAERSLRNAHLAGKTHPKTGVPFDAQGYPDFKAAGLVKMEVKIVQTGTRAGDVKAANHAAQLTQTPRGHSWHHHQDGGVPYPNVVDVEGLAGSPTDVQEFFGIGLPIATSNITWYRHELPDLLPVGLVPIACDSGGSLFCLSLSGDDAGGVIYVDLGSGKPTTFMVAESFNAFLGKLREG